MNVLREWVFANWPLINFVYGLVFFVLGMSITLQSRQYSRLRLARSLSWLAGFGILHGLFEWGDLFIPIQASFMSEPVVQILHAVHYLVLGLSFAFLFQFGIELFAPFSNQSRWVRFIPMVIFIIWLIVPYGLGLRYIDDFHRWSGFVKSISRYVLGFPGAVVSAIGLLRQVRNPVEPVGLPHIRKMVRLASAALFGYALFGGLIVDPSFYFPASVFNADNFSKLFIFPPMVFRSILGGILAFAIIRALEVFNIETDRMIWRMELEQVTSNEKQRLARDLHDGALQQVYAVGLLAQSLKKRVPAPQKENVEQLIGIVNATIDQLRAFLPQSQPESRDIDIFSAIAQVTEKGKGAVNIIMENKLPDPLYLPAWTASHIIAIVSEALSNVIRHSHSDRVEIHLASDGVNLKITIRDFGLGLPRTVDPGFGMHTMRDRARLLDADLDLDSTPGKGTSVELTVPMEK